MMAQAVLGAIGPVASCLSIVALCGSFAAWYMGRLAVSYNLAGVAALYMIAAAIAWKGLL